MASKIEEILGKSINSVKALKSEIKSLQDSLVGLDSESQEFKDTSMKLVAAQEELTKVTRAGKEENVAATDSLVGMRQEYKALYDTYKMLSEEQRNSDFGKNMAESLETLSNKINDTQKGVGDFRGNVGRYTKSIEEAFSNMGMSIGALKGPLNLATNGAKGLNDVFKLIAKNPIMAILTVLLAIFMKVADSIKKNEELTNRLKEAMSAFKPVLDFIANAFDFLAGVLVKTIEGLSKVGEKILSIIPGYKEAAASHKELAKATNELTKAQREANVENSKKEAEIERLREEASATDDVVEKKKLLEEAKAMQAEIDQKNIELAQEELRILEEYGEKTANSAEENEKLAAAQQKVNQAVAQGERNMRQYNKQISQVEKSTKSAGSAGKNWREEAKKLYEETVENSKTEIQKITEKYEKEKKLLEKYHYDTKLLTKKYNEDIASILNERTRKEKEEEDKRRKIRLDGLAQSREDLQGEWNLYSNFWSTALKSEFIEKGAIPAVEGLQEKIKQIFGTIQTTLGLDAAEEFENFVNSNTFDALGDEFSGLKDDVAAVNAEYGLSITTMKNLGTTLVSLRQENEKLLGELSAANVSEMTTERMVRDYEWALEQIKELGIGKETMNIFDPGSWNFDFIKEGMLEKEYELLEEQKNAYEIELANFKGTQEQKLQMMQEYYAVVEEMENRHRDLSELNQQRTQEMVDNLADAMDGIGNSLGTVKSSYESLIDSELKAGKIDEKTANEKKKRLQTLEKIQTAFSIATIAADAASGLFTIWKGYATETGVINPQTAAAAGPGAAVALGALNAKSLVSAIAKSASLAATATAQIMAAKNGTIASANNFSAESSGGESTGVGVAPAVIDSQPYSYVRTLQSESDTDEINKYNLWVAVSDIESGLGQRVKVTNESSF